MLASPEAASDPTIGAACSTTNQFSIFPPKTAAALWRGKKLMRGGANDRSGASAWWDTPAAIAGLMLLSTAPLWFTSLPPLIDLPGHMGRYHVELQLAHSPSLQRNWDFHWRLIGNLGADLLVVPLAAAFGLQRAVWMIAVALPPLMIWGIVRMSRALHRQLTPFALVAAPFALAYPYQYGFLNFWLSSALAFHAFASWVEADAARIPGLRRVALFAPAAGVIWLAHAYGWAILVVLIAAFELSRGWRGPRAWSEAALAIIRRIWPIMLPAVLMIAWRHGGAGSETGAFFQFDKKLAGMLCTLRDQYFWLDSLSLIFAVVLLYFGLRDRSARVNPALGVAAAIFLALILLMPARMFGSAYADIRLCPIFFIVGLTAIVPATAKRRVASVIAGAALALFIVRTAVTAEGFAAYDQSYARHLRALDHVPRGASIAVLTNDPNCEGWRHERVAHLGSLAIVRKDAFVNSQWENSAGLLLTPLRARGTAFNGDPSQIVSPPSGCGGPIGPALAEKIRQVPRDRFDYVWLLGFGPQARRAPPGARLLYSDDRSALYELRAPAPLEASRPDRAS
jgi:hypothetical protein